MKKYIDTKEIGAFLSFSSMLEDMIIEKIQTGIDSVAFVCIGTDRSTGDCLGPLVGYKLSSINYDNIYVYGSLDSPVHAKNLPDTLNSINASLKKPLIIAIDACLGSSDHIGYICIQDDSIKPGSGVNKNLPEVGDISITGIVNFSGFMELLILQNTRLNIVMKMADLISLGIKHTLNKLYYNNTIPGKFIALMNQRPS